MTIANEVTGCIALVLMLLVVRGFAPHMKLRGRDPIVLLMQGIFIGSTFIALRIATYDLGIPILRAFDVLAGDPMPFYVEVFNAVCNTGFALGAWRVLLGLHASLPEEDKAKYTWLTAPFYPKRLTIFRRTSK